MVKKARRFVGLGSVFGIVVLLAAVPPARAGIGTSDLGITKDDGATVSAIGGSVTYTIVGSNAGPDDVFGATVTDTFPSELACTWTCAASAGSSCTAMGSGNISDAVNLLETGTVTYTATCTISGAATPGTLANTATITSPAVDPNPADNSATDSNALWPVADLAITKTDGVTMAAPGDSLTYTIVASNAGPMDSFGATVTDSFPAGLACTWTCAASAGSSCTAMGSGDINDAVSLLSGGTATYIASCAIDLTATGTLSNTATVAGMVIDGTPGNDAATDADTVLEASTDLAITKSDSPDPVVAGENLTYTMTVTNNGPSNSTGGTVTDVLPSGVSFSSSSDCSEAGGTVTCAIGALGVGASQMVSFVVTVDPSQTAAISNTATIAANETDPTAGNDSATATTTVDAETDLSITKADSPDPVNAGNDLTYTMTVTNSGPSASTGGTVTDVLPGGVSFSSSSDCSEAGGTVTCAIGALGVGASQMVSFVVTVDPSQTAAISNTATIAANETDPTAGNDSATATTTVGIETDLSITKTDSPDPVAAGGDLTYTLTVLNSGPSASTGGTVTDVLPGGVSFSSSSDCSEAGGTVTCAIGALGVGASQMVSFVVTVDPSQTAAISNTATIAANETDPTAGNDSATATTTVGIETDLSITKTDSPDPVAAGGDLTYTLTVLNNGPSASTGATVTDVLPAGVSFSSSGDCTEAGGTVTCAIGALGVGASQMVSFVVTVDPSQTAAISNTATVAANETDPVAGNDSATATTTVATNTDLSLVKTDAPDPVTAGEDLTYTLTVTNNGPSVSTGATATDVLPAGVGFSSSGDCTEAGGTVTCAIGALGVGASQMVSFVVTVDPSQIAAISNTATVAANETDPVAGNNSATASTTVATEADLGITQVDSSDPVPPSAAYAYTVTVTNAGPSDAVGVSVLDTLPAGVTLLSTAGCAEDPAGVPTCTLGTIAAGGMASYTINVTSPAAVGTVSNTATVSATTTDNNPANDTATEDTAVALTALQADLSITKDDGVATAVPGGAVTYTIVAANAGPDDVPDATVTDTFPASLTCTWTCAGAGGGACTAAGSGNIADTVDLPNGAAVTYTAVCSIDSAATGNLVNTAVVLSPATDTNPGNESATDTDTLIPSADLSIASVTMPNPVLLGEPVSVDVTVANDGPSDATGTVVTTTLPAGIGLDATVGCAEDPNGVPTCTLGAVPAGLTATFTIEGTAAAQGTTTGSVMVASDVPDPNGANDDALAEVTVGSVLDIPTLGSLGFAALVMLLALAAVATLRRVGPARR